MTILSEQCDFAVTLDGHAKDISIALGPGGRFRLTPFYDVLTAQPSLDAGQIQRKKFKLAMSVGKSRHYPAGNILPRHFLQTAALADVGAKLMQTILDDLAESALNQTDAVIEALPRGIPHPLVTSVRAAIENRARLLADAASEGGKVMAAP